MPTARLAEGAARRHEDVRLLQQELAEGPVVQARLLHAGKQVEGAPGPEEGQKGDLFDPVGGVEDAVPVDGDVLFRDVVPQL